MTEKKYAGTDVGFGCLLWLIMVPFVWLINAYVINTLWGWFVTPVFGISAPGMILCYGLDIFVSYVRADHIRMRHDIGKRFEKEDTFSAAIFGSMMSPISAAVCALLFGYLTLLAAQHYGVLP